MSRSKKTRDDEIHHFWQFFAEMATNLLLDVDDDASISESASIEPLSSDED